MTDEEIKAKARAEINKIKNRAVVEYLTLKTEHYSFKFLAIAAGATFVFGLLIGRAL